MHTLNDKHRAELHASGIDDETIAAAGIYTGNVECRDLVGFIPAGSNGWGDCIVYPFFGFDGQRIDYHQIKPDFPRDRGGNPIKYESPENKEARAYFPPGFGGLFKSGRVVLITEGIKKALAAVQRGFPCIAIAGVWNWAQGRLTTTTGRKYGKQKLIPDLDAIRWSGRQVVIAFDSDAVEKRLVRLAEQRLAVALQEKGAAVRVLRLPKLGDGKTGLDDFLVHHGEDGPAELQVLIDAAQEPEPLPELTKLDIARILIDEFYTRPGGRLLRWHRGQFYAYQHTRYLDLPESELTMMAIQQLDRMRFDSSPRTAAEIVKALGSECRVEFTVALPAFLGKSQPDTSLWVSMENGILDLRQIMEGKPVVLRAHTPEWFSLNVLPYPYRGDADCPRFRAFLDEVLEGDEDRIDLLSEWTGYNLAPDTSMHKFMLMEGEGANGKSVYLQVLRALVGPDNCSHVPLEAFGQRFQLAPTVGKLANIVFEVGELQKFDEAVFKQFVAGEVVPIDRKGLPILNIVPTARVTIATNNRPRWVDRSDGVWRRMLLMPWRVQIPEERQDRQLAQRIIDEELPGVFLWAVRGLLKLRERGRFTEADVCSEAMQDYRQEVNPARTFLSEECEAKPGAELQARWLYAGYQAWCQQSGYRPLNDKHFGQEVRRVYRVQRVRRDVVDLDGTERRAWCLVGLASDAASRAEHDAEERRQRELMRQAR